VVWLLFGLATAAAGAWYLTRGQTGGGNDLIPPPGYECDAGIYAQTIERARNDGPRAALDWWTLQAIGSTAADPQLEEATSGAQSGSSAGPWGALAGAIVNAVGGTISDAQRRLRCRAMLRAELERIYGPRDSWADSSGWVATWGGHVRRNHVQALLDRVRVGDQNISAIRRTSVRAALQDGGTPAAEWMAAQLTSVAHRNTFRHVNWNETQLAVVRSFPVFGFPQTVPPGTPVTATAWNPPGGTTASPVEVQGGGGSSIAPPTAAPVTVSGGGGGGDPSGPGGAGATAYPINLGGGGGVKPK